MPRAPPAIYYEALNAMTEFLENLEDPEAFNKAYKGGKEQRLQSIRILAMETGLNFNTYNTGVDTHEVINGHYADLAMALEDNFNLSPEHAEMCWKVALVWFRVGIFNTPHYFKDGPTGPILLMAKYCPSVLWRIITLQNLPDCPAWADNKGERAQKQFRAAMDEAATVDEKTDVIRIKAKLVDYFKNEAEGMDHPDAEICEWLGMDSEEDEEEEEDTNCCCDGVVRAGCPVHGTKGNGRSFFG